MPVSGSATATESWSYDALDRPVSQTQTSGGSTTTTAYRYLGDTNALTRETLSGGTNTTRKYSYDALGNRISFSDGANRFSYLYDPHGSVSLLLDQSSAVKASYGYSAYGSANTAISKTAAGFTDTNPYRYEAKRLDTGSNSYDMGARRYSPGTGRWLQQDLYYGAFDNLGLAQDPLNANRYLFTGANPITYVELDGHRFDEGTNGGGGGLSGGTPTSFTYPCGGRLCVDTFIYDSGGGGCGSLCGIPKKVAKKIKKTVTTVVAAEQELTNAPQAARTVAKAVAPYILSCVGGAFLSAAGGPEAAAIGCVLDVSLRLADRYVGDSKRKERVIFAVKVVEALQIGHGIRQAQKDPAAAIGAWKDLYRKVLAELRR